MLEHSMLEINAEYLPMVELLKQHGFHVNHMKVQRLMKKLGLCVSSYWGKSRKYNSYKGQVGKIAKTSSANVFLLRASSEDNHRYYRVQRLRYRDSEKTLS